MSRDQIFVCCGEQPTHLFVYENEQIYGICKTHFNSQAHRCFVKTVIDVKTNQKFIPSEIFEEENQIV